MNTQSVAEQANVHKDTLLRWLRGGLVPEPKRDRRGWRDFTTEQTESIIKFARGERSEQNVIRDNSDNLAVGTLKDIDWDFKDAKTDYLTHSIHPYPAKFIPQIPNALIQELSSVGDTVLDPFCGSGTTLVEALTLKRQAIGLDANPIACLISRAKTIRLGAVEIEAIRDLREPLNTLAVHFSSGQASLFDVDEPCPVPTSDRISFWFESFVIQELAYIKGLCLTLPTAASKTLALAAFSSIIVSVSRQDSDTRYVRREKHNQAGDTVRRFRRALEFALERSIEFNDLVEDRFECDVVQANILTPPESIKNVDLIVCSPPYPNAYSYHLYHMTRMLWLDIDPVPFKQIEIGSHRKYSNRGKNGASVDTFRNEMKLVVDWFGKILKPHGYCCFVVGDSTLNGILVHNNELLTTICETSGFRLEADIIRTLNAAKKSFNPKIGKIRQEHILVLRKE